MSSEQYSSAWEGIEAGWKNGKLAHAYLLQGAPHGAALHFAENMLNLIFDNHPQVQTRNHPDLIWLEPQSKSRRITIDEIRAMIQQLSQTALSGGWKAGIIFYADRMTEQAANAFLKTLEEPPPRTLLIMITDEPQSLLATITSRCQRIVLKNEDDTRSNHWKKPLFEILHNFPPNNIPEVELAGAKLSAILKDLYKLFEKEELEKIPEDVSAKERKTLLEARATSRMLAARSDILRTMLLWQRDVLFKAINQDDSTLHFQDEIEAITHQAELSTPADVHRSISDTEKMIQQLERNLPAELVFSNYASQLVPTSTSDSKKR